MCIFASRIESYERRDSPNPLAYRIGAFCGAGGIAGACNQAVRLGRY